MSRTYYIHAHDTTYIVDAKTFDDAKDYIKKRWGVKKGDMKLKEVD